MLSALFLFILYYFRRLVACEAVFNSVFYFSSLAVVESVECSYEISCDPSDSLEAYAFSDLSVYVLNYFIVHLSTSVSLPFIIVLIRCIVKCNLYILLFLFCT